MFKNSSNETSSIKKSSIKKVGILAVLGIALFWFLILSPTVDWNWARLRESFGSISSWIRRTSMVINQRIAEQALDHDARQLFGAEGKLESNSSVLETLSSSVKEANHTEVMFTQQRSRLDEGRTVLGKRSLDVLQGSQELQADTELRRAIADAPVLTKQVALHRLSVELSAPKSELTSSDIQRIDNTVNQVFDAIKAGDTSLLPSMSATIRNQLSTSQLSAMADVLPIENSKMDVIALANGRLQIQLDHRVIMQIIRVGSDFRVVELSLL